MDISQLDGALVALLPGGGRGSKLLRALVVTSDHQDLAVRLEEPPASVPGELLVVLGREGGQCQARATVLAVGPVDWRLTLQSAWHARLDNRLAPRYPLFEDAVVRIPGTAVSLPARMVDFSTAGAALETAAWPGGRNLIITAEWGGRRVELPSQCVLSERTWRGATVHCQFAGLDGETESVVEGWVADLRQAFEQVQTCLAYRIDDPWQAIASRARGRAA